MTTRSRCAVLALCTSACLNEPMIKESMTDESSSDGSDDTTYSTVSASASASSTSAATSSTDESESGDDAEASTGGESSTGEPSIDWALAFDGSSHARAGDYDWTAPNWTIEVWVEILDTSATGLIFDAQNGVDAGWALYIQPDWHQLVFSFFDDEHVNQVVAGPSVEQLGVGWHHLAATKDGTTAFLHVDGVAVSSESVSVEPFFATVVLSVGAVSTDEPFWSLQQVVVDDIRLTTRALYAGPFDPPLVFEDVRDSLVILDLDEGEGVVADDEVSGISFTIESPSWVDGYDG